MDEKTRDAALTVADRLEFLSVPYLIGGSVASVLLGEMRTTLDIDLMCLLRPSDVRRVCAAFDRDFFVQQEALRDAVRDFSSTNFIHKKDFVKVDLFVRADAGFARSQIERRLRVSLGDGKVYIASPEDIVLQKLVWYRMTDETSDRQWRDVLGVLKVQREAIDRDYMHTWSVELRVSDLLERALRQAGLGAC